MNLPKHPEVIIILSQDGGKQILKEHVASVDCTTCPDNIDCDIKRAVNGEFDETVKEYKLFKERIIASSLGAIVQMLASGMEPVKNEANETNVLMN